MRAKTTARSGHQHSDLTARLLNQQGLDRALAETWTPPAACFSSAGGQTRLVSVETAQFSQLQKVFQFNKRPHPINADAQPFQASAPDPRLHRPLASVQDPPRRQSERLGLWICSLWIRRICRPVRLDRADRFRPDLGCMDYLLLCLGVQTIDCVRLYL